MVAPFSPESDKASRIVAGTARDKQGQCLRRYNSLYNWQTGHFREHLAARTSQRQGLAQNQPRWSIDSGLHQRLDVSHLDDLCRVRKPASMLFIGMFRRLCNSLCVHWIS